MVVQKSDLPKINMGLIGGDLFFIKIINVMCKRWECKQMLTRGESFMVFSKIYWFFFFCNNLFSFKNYLHLKNLSHKL